MKFCPSHPALQVGACLIGLSLNLVHAADPVAPSLVDGVVKWGDDTDEKPTAVAFNPKVDSQLTWTKKDNDTGKHVVHDGYTPFSHANLPCCEGQRTYTFHRPNDSSITDYEPTVNGKAGDSVDLKVSGANHGIEFPWAIGTLDDVEFPDSWRVPYFAIDDPVTEAAIYVAINLPQYFAANPLGPLGGRYGLGDSLDDLGISLTDGVLDGLEGIFFATTPFEFDAGSDGGWSPLGGDVALLDAASFQSVHGELRIIAIESGGAPIPEASTWVAGVVMAGLLAFQSMTPRRTWSRSVSRSAGFIPQEGGSPTQPRTDTQSAAPAN